MLRFSKLARPRKTKKFEFSSSNRIASRVRRLIKNCSLNYIDSRRVFCVESQGSSSRAYARIWGLSRIWQEVLEAGPAYVLEVTHRFAKLSSREQDRVLLHELAHIPKNFSGALLGHNGLEKRVRDMENNMKKIRN